MVKKKIGKKINYNSKEMRFHKNYVVWEQTVPSLSGEIIAFR